MDMNDGLIFGWVLNGQGGGRTVDWDGARAWAPNDGVLWLQHLGPQFREAAADTERRRLADGQVEVASLLLDNGVQQSINMNSGHNFTQLLVTGA